MYRRGGEGEGGEGERGKGGSFPFCLKCEGTVPESSRETFFWQLTPSKAAESPLQEAGG